MSRILIADDEAALVRLMEKTLVRSGHEVVAARDGLEALQMLAPGDIDLAVIDIVMPNMNGLELIKEVRKKYPAVKIITVSGGGNVVRPSGFLDLAKELGASCCLAKPFTMEELSSRVNELCSGRP
jgi:DNA-binding response OmpR family regulator